MRIGIYHPRVGTSTVGGTENFLRNMIKKLGQEHEIILYTGEGQLLNEISELDIETVQIPYWKKESRSSKLFSRYTPIQPAEPESVSMYRKASCLGITKGMEKELDVLSTYYYLDNLLLSRRVDVPHLFRFPGIKNPSIRWKTMVKFAKTDCYIAGSEGARKRGEQWLDINVDGVVTAGVDVERFTAGAEQAIDSERNVILYVGRLDPGKGLSRLLDAVSMIDSAEYSIELVLVGDGILRNELEQQTKHLEIEDRVTFVGAVSHCDIHTYYSSCDVFVLPSEYEGFPNVTMEAMATGKPVVSTTVPGVEEQIAHDETGLLIDPEDTRALADTICLLLENPEKRQQLGAAARNYAVDNFAWDVQAKKLEKLLKDCVVGI